MRQTQISAVARSVLSAHIDAQVLIERALACLYNSRLTDLALIIEGNGFTVIGFKRAGVRRNSVCRGELLCFKAIKINMRSDRLSVNRGSRVLRIIVTEV